MEQPVLLMQIGGGAESNFWAHTDFSVLIGMLEGQFF